MMDASYLQYPNRKHGQDHALYDWRLSKEQPRLQWSNDAKVAICFIIPLEFFPLNPSSDPFKHPGAMVTPYPDLRHFTVRDYGNRVGVYRLIEALGETRASFAVNTEVARRYPPLLDAIKDHEIAAHGISTDHIHHEDLTTDEELNLIETSLAKLNNAKGWLSPARNQSSRTLQLLGEAGLDYCLDWESDQVPIATSTGVTLVPNNYELSDFTLLHTRKQTEESWLTQIKTAIDHLIGEFDQLGSQMLGLTLTPYIMGQPFRIWALRDLLSHITATEGVEIFTCGEIAKQFKEQTL